MSHERGTIHTLRNAVSLGLRRNGAGLLHQPVRGCVILAKWLMFLILGVFIYNTGKRSVVRIQRWRVVSTHATPGMWSVVEKQQLFWCCTRYPVGHRRSHRLARASGESFSLSLFCPSRHTSQPSISLHPCCCYPLSGPRDRTIPSGSSRLYFHSSFYTALIRSCFAKAFTESRQNFLTSQSNSCSFWHQHLLFISSIIISLKSRRPLGQKSPKRGWVNI